MSKLLNLDVIKLHQPKFGIGGHIVGCEACAWEPYSFRPDWIQYLEHVPQVDGGQLVLNTEDVNLLREIDKAFHMMDPISEARLSMIMPALAAKIRQMHAMLETEGIEIRVIQALRSWQQQQDLWKQGRDVDGSVIDKSKVVTYAAGGHSWHNFGMAVDCAPSTLGPGQMYSPDWHADHPSWKRMEAVGVSLGLASGATWKRLADAPHFELVGQFPESAPNDEVRQLFKDGGMQAVWRESGAND